IILCPELELVSSFLSVPQEMISPIKMTVASFKIVCIVLNELPTVESPKGVSPSGSHGTVLESLPSYGSSCLITKVSIPLRTCDTYGRTNFQCANKSGRLVYFICNHLIDAIL